MPTQPGALWVQDPPTQPLRQLGAPAPAEAPVVTILESPQLLPCPPVGDKAFPYTTPLRIPPQNADEQLGAGVEERSPEPGSGNAIPRVSKAGLCPRAARLRAERSGTRLRGPGSAGAPEGGGTTVPAGAAGRTRFPFRIKRTPKPEQLPGPRGSWCSSSAPTSLPQTRWLPSFTSRCHRLCREAEMAKRGPARTPHPPQPPADTPTTSYRNGSGTFQPLLLPRTSGLPIQKLIEYQKELLVRKIIHRASREAQATPPSPPPHHPAWPPWAWRRLPGPFWKQRQAETLPGGFPGCCPFSRCSRSFSAPAREAPGRILPRWLWSRRSHRGGEQGRFPQRSRPAEPLLLCPGAGQLLAEPQLLAERHPVRERRRAGSGRGSGPTQAPLCPPAVRGLSVTSRTRRQEQMCLCPAGCTTDAVLKHTDPGSRAPPAPHSPRIHSRTNAADPGPVTALPPQYIWYADETEPSRRASESISCFTPSDTRPKGPLSLLLPKPPRSSRVPADTTSWRASRVPVCIFPSALSSFGQRPGPSASHGLFRFGAFSIGAMRSGPSPADGFWAARAGVTSSWGTARASLRRALSQALSGLVSPQSFCRSRRTCPRAPLGSRAAA